MTTVHRTNHWRGVVGLSLLAGALGILLTRPLVLLLAAVGVGYAIYPRLTTQPPADLSLTRRLSDTAPTPGETVTVTVEVRNESDRTLPDVRLVDGVPAMLSVTDGTARHAAVLGPGETTQYSYEVTAAHGTHQFRAATAMVRDVSGGTEIETTLPATTDEITCRRAVPDPPVGNSADNFPGRVLTSDAGDGIEFARTREYRPGDSPSRIDWNQYARTGRLTTVEFREERHVSVVVCLDARPSAYAGAGGGPHALSRGIAATQDLLDAVWEMEERAGLAAIGRELCWLAPDRGHAHEQAARRLLLSHPTLSPRPPGDGTVSTDSVQRQLRELRRRLDRTTQLVVVSPLADEFVVETALAFAAAGRPVTVVSPDVTGADTPGERLATIERRNRCYRLRRGGVTVVDWDPETSLAGAVASASAQARWS